MAVPPFRPPVYQPLHANDWERPKGNLEYRVTQTYDHINYAVSPYPHHALDLGNGTSGDALFAPSDAVIVAEGWLTEPWSQSATAAQCAEWGSPNPSGWGGIMVVGDAGGGWYWALAHMSRTIVSKGQKVLAGQQVGNLGGSGAANGVAHCHWDLYQTIDGKRVKVDPWPLLEQNYVAPLPDTSIGGIDMPTTAGFIAIVNRKTVIGNGVKAANFRADASTTSDSLGIFPAGTVVVPVAKVQGEVIGGDSTWYVAANWVDTLHRYAWGCYHASVLDPLVVSETAPDPETADLLKRTQNALTITNSRLSQHAAIGGPVPIPK